MGGRDLRKELTWQIEGMAGRPACFRTVSRGMWKELVSGKWAEELEVGWKPWMVQSRGGMWSDVRVKRVL